MAGATGTGVPDGGTGVVRGSSKSSPFPINLYREDELLGEGTFGKVK